MAKIFFFSCCFFFSSFFFAAESEREEKILLTFFELELGFYSTFPFRALNRALHTNHSRSLFLTNKTTAKDIFEAFVPTYDWKFFREKWEGEVLHVFLKLRFSKDNVVHTFFVFRNEDDVFLKNEILKSCLSIYLRDLPFMSAIKECSFFIPNFNKKSLNKGDLSLLMQFFPNFTE